MNTITITDRVLDAAIEHKPKFSTMDILFALNKQHPYPMVDLRQVQHALDEHVRRGVFVKRCAGRFEWPNE